MKFIVFFQTTASGNVVVDVPDAITDIDEAREYAEEHADPNNMTLCYHCVGGNDEYSLELGEWEPAYDYDKNIIPARLIDKDED